MTRSTRASTVTSTRASRSAQNQRHPGSEVQKRGVEDSTQSTSQGSTHSTLKSNQGKEKQNGQASGSDDDSDEDEVAKLPSASREVSSRKRPHTSDSSEPKKAKLAKARNGSCENNENGVENSSDEDTPQRSRTKSHAMNGNKPGGSSKTLKGNLKGVSKDKSKKSKGIRSPNKGAKRQARNSESSASSESDDEVILTGVTRGSKQKALDSMNAMKTYEELDEVLDDSEDEADSEDGVEEISSDSEGEDDEEEDEEEEDEEEEDYEGDDVMVIESDDDKVATNSGPKAKGQQARDFSGKDMTRMLKEMKKEYADLVKQKDEDILRLKNEVKYKDQQLESMNDLVTRNMELEAKVSAILGSPEVYEAEVLASTEKKVKAPVENKKETPKKKDKDKGETQDNTQDSDIEEIIDDKKPKAKRAPSVEVIPDEDNAQESSPPSGKKGRRRSLRKKVQEDEAEKIEALFVSDDEEDAGSKEDQKDKRTPKKKTKKEEKEEGEDKKKDTKKKETKKKDKDENENASGSEKDDDSPDKGRHNIRKLMADKKLKEETKAAAKEEKDRIERVAKLKEKHKIVCHTDSKTRMRVFSKLVLAFKKDEKTPLVEVNQKLVKKLKPHQVDGVIFLWDSMIETVEAAKRREPGSGCVLAHCMGLGKTLSVITFVHTLLTHKQLKLKTCLVVCPLNTVLNWSHEWEKWLDKKDRLPTYELATAKDNHARANMLSKWHKEGGIMIMGYQLFRILATSTTKSKKKKKIFDDSLINPGPDLVVCDEGHVLKNDASAISKCMNKIRSRRRIILTGTPLQNNLIEYHCMVSFVKPSLLGTRKEFCNRFVNPITNGQHADSTPRDVKLMKRRAHVIHKMLSGCVQRRDYTALISFLPPKYEYIISIRLSPLQIKLYEKYLDVHRNNASSFFRGTSLFSDYQALMRIWTHPWVLKMDEIRQEKKMTYCDDDDDELGSYLASETSEEEEEEAEEEMETSSKSSQVSSEVESKDKEESEEERPLRRTRRSATKDSEKKESQNNAKSKTRNKETKDYDSDVEEIFPDEAPVRKAKLVAGEVIKHWQTNSRRKGVDEQNPDSKRPEEQWWTEYVKEADHKQKLELSGKLVLLFDILRMAEGLCDKVLVFSQSILSLDLIEDFLAYKTEESEKLREGKKGKTATSIPLWKKDEDYCRMDGSTSALKRKTFTNNFNCAKNKRMRLFLISTKAGGLGINLDSANRVIIFDASWNPSHDIQSIFRAYRFGQEKDVYIYRFLAQGTMEEKIYERQVTKETLSQRVIDEHQLDRHFTASDLQELYLFQPDRLDDPNRKERPTPKVPKDIILSELLSEHKEWVVGYHEHDSLLEKRPDEDLSEEERKAAWDEYEKEKQGFMAYQYRPPAVPVTTYNYQYKPPVVNPLPQTTTSQPALITPSPALTSLLGSGLLPLVAPPAGFSSEQAKLNFQLSQLPRVVQEILKYNPDITPVELQTRLRAFMGMHTRYSNVPGFAMPQNLSAQGSGSADPSAMSGEPMVGQPELSLPSTSYDTSVSDAVSDAAASAAAAAFTTAPMSSWAGPNGPSPAQLSQAISSTITAATTSAMPSRLPLPGRVPAFNR